MSFMAADSDDPWFDSSSHKFFIVFWESGGDVTCHHVSHPFD